MVPVGNSSVDLESFLQRWVQKTKMQVRILKPFFKKSNNVITTSRATHFDLSEDKLTQVGSEVPLTTKCGGKLDTI